MSIPIPLLIANKMYNWFLLWSLLYEKWTFFNGISDFLYQFLSEKPSVSTVNTRNYIRIVWGNHLKVCLLSVEVRSKLISWHYRGSFFWFLIVSTSLADQESKRRSIEEHHKERRINPMNSKVSKILTDVLIPNFSNKATDVKATKIFYFQKNN